MPADATPLVSVLIPVYNVEQYLDQCLDSVCRQGLTDFEAIVVNDGSTDGSLQVIEHYLARDGRFALIDQPNRGYGASMNQGLRAARGKYIAFLESDDWFEPDTLARLYQAAISHAAEVAKANCYHYWPKRLLRDRKIRLVPSSQTGRLVDPASEHQIFYKPAAVWAGLYERSFIQANNICFTETPGASYQDTSFNFKVWASAKQAVFLDQAFVHYRQDNLGSSVKATDKVYCVVDEFDEIDAFLGSRETPDWLWAVKAQLRYDTYLWNYERLNERFRWEFLEVMSKAMAGEVQAGRLDWQLFDEWDRRDLKTIIGSPEEYHRQRQASGVGSRPAKLRHLMDIGGLGLAARFAWSRLWPSR